MAGGSSAAGTSLLSRLQGIFSAGSSGTSVGLSVGTSTVKLVELQRVGKGWRLLHFGVVPLPEESIVNREITNPVAVSETVKSLSSQVGLKSKQVCSSLSGNSVIVKRMTLEVQNPKELDEQIEFEAEHYIPFDISEVVLDYQLLSPIKEKRADILLVAVKKSVLESYLGAVEQAGLKTKIMDVDYFALSNLLEVTAPPSAGEAVAVVDLGASSTKVVVIQDGVPAYTKDTPTGGQQLTHEIQRHMNLSYMDAESLKTEENSAGMPQEVSELMHLMAENFTSEIKRALEFYQASSGSAPITAIYLTGGSAKIPDVQRLIEEGTGIPTQMLNPFNAISYDPAVFTPEYLQSIAPIAAIPLGLAVRAGSGKGKT
jgi:type IV pilus assembly protein PilM